uniref:Basic helix-loop-helix transcription factor n=1 Tax=Clarkia gracilis subsp. sonomensis TaxID=1906248 RepID=A0A7U3S1G8_9MYRT|nr:basic helix-loop-helix transcription factor [Clarkia gracilis subsp. sonomensis]QPB72534.1 basic helix-loop-helix transcription factor [Clarkia gracilis subsp. sonomensis]
MALNQGSVPENLKEQLSLAVRNIQWSYAIFWSISATQPGVLEWGEGYYNGDIKTRKTIQAVEFNAEELGLQRSEQLRELYDSLSAGESSPHCKRPCAALSPEDLSDAEWYYLVCMSFVFDFGQCLPGRTLATGEHFWLCNAHSADSKIFTRSLLAKSASIQTIVCFPYLGGVIELGTTEQVMDDLGIIQRIKDSYLEIPLSVCVKKPDPDTHHTGNVDLPYDNNICITDVVPVLPRLDIASSNIGSTDLDIPEDSFIIEAMNDAGDCISHTFVELGNSGPILKEENAVEPTTDDLFYESVISSLVNSQDWLGSGPRSRKHESSFVKWKKGGLLNVRRTRASESQKLLKRSLFEVPKMHRVESKISERFQTLNSIVPSITNVDEVSILDSTIDYLNELKKRVDDLESCRLDLKELAAGPTKNILETSEQTSDNYESVSTTPTRTKRKIRDHDQTTLTVSVTGKVVQIDVKCSWREGLLLEIIEALRNLRLDSHAVQSSIIEGVLFLNMKCKLCGSLISSAGLIRQKLEKVVGRS